MKLKIPQSTVFVAIHEIENTEVPKNIISSNFKNLLIFFFAIRITIKRKVGQLKILFRSSFAVVRNISGI